MLVKALISHLLLLNLHPFIPHPFSFFCILTTQFLQFEAKLMAENKLRFVLRQEADSVRGSLQMLVSVARRQPGDALLITAREPMSGKNFQIEIEDDVSHLPVPFAKVLPLHGQGQDEEALYNDLTFPEEEEAIMKLCSRLRLVKVGQVSAPQKKSFLYNAPTEIWNKKH